MATGHRGFEGWGEVRSHLGGLCVCVQLLPAGLQGPCKVSAVLVVFMRCRRVKYAAASYVPFGRAGWLICETRGGVVISLSYLVPC